MVNSFCGRELESFSSSDCHERPFQRKIIHHKNFLSTYDENSL